ncbi:MAG: hypothetical protein LBT29_07275 [Flavobacteriaceae bacterium]|jgi:hypothetical protein|nr:hypothetical protein [Flavobacteriaceae bacterium]
MMKKILLFGAILGVLMSVESCKKDDDVKILSIEEQNVADDLAIQNLLDEYYYTSDGNIHKYSTTDTVSVAEKPSLRSIATANSDGSWYAVFPGAPASGEQPNGENNILIHYRLSYFTAGEGGTYTLYSSAESTLDGLGIPKENPYFYKKPAADTVTVESYYINKGLVDNLKKFHPSGKTLYDPYKLQGIIIVPSRLGYARNSNYLALPNATFVLNFEIYKVSDE